MRNRTIGEIISTRSIEALKRLDQLLGKGKLSERELVELRTLRKTLNIKSLAIKGAAIASVAVLSGCAMTNREGFSFHASAGIAATDSRQESIATVKKSTPMSCELFGYACGGASSEVANDK